MDSETRRAIDDLLAMVADLANRVKALESGGPGGELRLYNLSEVARMTGLGRSTVGRLVKAGRLKTVYIDPEEGKPFVRHADLVAWQAGLNDDD